MTELRSATFTITVDGKEKGTSIVALTKNVKDLDNVEKKLTDTLGKEVKVQKEVNVSQKEANALSRAAIREYNKQQRAIKQVTDFYKQQNQAVKMSADRQAVFNAQMRAGVDPLSRQGREIAKLVTEHQRLQAAQNKGMGSMRNMRGIAQNLGWQLQDTAVQLQMGTSALVVFSQQGSQIASAFGPAGAAVGALIAITGAVLGVAAAANEAVDALDELIKKEAELVNRPTTLTTQIDELNGRLKDTTDELEKMYRARENFASLPKIEFFDTGTDKTAEELDKINNGIKVQESLVRKLKLELADLTGATYGSDSLWSAAGIITADEIKAMNAEVAAERKAFNQAGIAEATAMAAEFDRLRKDDIKAQKEAEKQRKESIKQSNNDAIAESNAMYVEMERLRKEHARKMTEIDRQVDQLRSSQSSPETRILDTYLNQQMLLSEALDAQLISQQEHQAMSEKSYADYVTNMEAIGTRMVQAQLGVWSTFLGSMEATMGQLAAIAQEGSAEAKALFLVTKAIAVANTLVNAHMAAMQAAADPTNPTVFGKFAAADAMLALGYANAGIIAGTAIAGAFDKGGYIPAGKMGITSEIGDELVNGVLVKGPARVTSREDTAKMMEGAAQSSKPTVIQQNFNVNGNPDKAALETMAKMAKQATVDAYALVENDFKTGRGIRSTLKKSIGR